MKAFANRVSATLLAAGLMAVAGPAIAADLALPISGTLAGSVSDPSGTPQMGATVQLFNRFSQLIAKANTGPDGRFVFAALPADSYSVRVSSARFLPALRDHVSVRPGVDSMLQIHLATLFSSVELSYRTANGAMSDDWKWVLRSSPATRPITRFDKGIGSKEAAARPFSDTHAVLFVSGGDASIIDDQPASEVGTGFLLSTNFFGKNQIRLGGNYTQGTNLNPAGMSFSAVYARDGDGVAAPPEVSITVSQFGVFGANGDGSPVNQLAVRTMVVSTYQVLDPVDGVHLEYGMTGQSVDYYQHTSRVAPYARATVAAVGGEVVASYSDGGRPSQLLAHQEGATDDAETASSAPAPTAPVPDISNHNGRLELQRTRTYELGYRKDLGQTTIGVSAFRDSVANGRLDVTGELSALNPADLLADAVSPTAVYNIGAYARTGFMSSVNQRFSDSLSFGLAYGRMGGFTTASSFADAPINASTLLSKRVHNVASANLCAKLPRTGTRLEVGYGWMDGNALVPRHVFTTQNTYFSQGLNIGIRQPLPSAGFPARIELTADLRNLLAQGYLPVSNGGHNILFVQSPRAVRGGLNFIF